jgi:hypothetical protein
MTDDEKALEAHEARVRRQLARLNDYRLEKTPARSHLRKWFGVGYQVVNVHNMVVAGCGNHQYEMSLEDVEGFIRGKVAEAA